MCLNAVEPIRLDNITETRMSLGVNDQHIKNVNPHQAAIQPTCSSVFTTKWIRFSQQLLFLLSCWFPWVRLNSTAFVSRHRLAHPP